MKEWWEWALSACGLLILFFLGLGGADIRRKMRQIDELEKEVAIIKDRLGIDK